jgi:adenosylcobinamide amidohydrolase
MSWETLISRPSFVVRRRGRFLIVALGPPHEVLSTSVENGGLVSHVRYLVNHQCSEGSGHDARARIVHAGGATYHEVTCREAGLPADEVALMGTAANMNYAAIATERDDTVEVTAVVTAGVQTNATCAGDPAQWRESDGIVARVAEVAGTINTVLIVSHPVMPGVLARLAMTITEGKSAALQRLAVPSCYSADLATGTGTDQFLIAAPVAGGPPLTTASAHVKFGEIVGLAVRKATIEALRWQNGLESSYTRGLFHALGRYGLTEATILEDLSTLVSAADLELLRRNSKAAFYEPLVGAAAHALATVCDRVRHGTLPESVARDALVQQAANLAANLAASPERWSDYRDQLHRAAPADPKGLALAAIALGWSEKWRTR